MNQTTEILTPLPPKRPSSDTSVTGSNGQAATEHGTHGSEEAVDPVQNIEKYSDFDSMGLHEHLLRGVYAFGFEKPSAIQQQAIVPFSKGRDIIAQAQSGTGKTGTYTIGMLQQIDTAQRVCQGLVLVPTRELATQVQKTVQAIGDYMGAKVHACVG